MGLPRSPVPVRDSPVCDESGRGNDAVEVASATTLGILAHRPAHGFGHGYPLLPRSTVEPFRVLDGPADDDAGHLCRRRIDVGWTRMVSVAGKVDVIASPVRTPACLLAHSRHRVAGAWGGTTSYSQFWQRRSWEPGTTFPSPSSRSDRGGFRVSEKAKRQVAAPQAGVVDPRRFVHVRSTKTMATDDTIKKVSDEIWQRIDKFFKIISWVFVLSTMWGFMDLLPPDALQLGLADTPKYLIMLLVAVMILLFLSDYVRVSLSIWGSHKSPCTKVLWFRGVGSISCRSVCRRYAVLCHFQCHGKRAGRNRNVRLKVWSDPTIRSGVPSASFGAPWKAAFSEWVASPADNGRSSRQPLEPSRRRRSAWSLPSCPLSP